jgi:hypothetical protein
MTAVIRSGASTSIGSVRQRAGSRGRSGSRDGSCTGAGSTRGVAGTGGLTGSTLIVLDGPSSDAISRSADGGFDSERREGFMTVRIQSYRCS